MIRRMLTHTMIAALLVAAAAFSYQALATGDGFAGSTRTLVAALASGERGHGHAD